MSQFNLSAPVTLDPRQAVTLHIRVFKADCEANAVHVLIDYRDSAGEVIKTDSLQLTGAQIATWIANQETTILNRYTAAKGMTGTIS